MYTYTERERGAITNSSKLFYCVKGYVVYHIYMVVYNLPFFLFDRYDPDTDRWQSIACMNSARIGVGLACVNRLLFAVGGFDGFQRLRSVEQYDPEKDEWSFVSPMNTTRSGAGKPVFANYHYNTNRRVSSSRAAVCGFDTQLWHTIEV